MKETVHDLSNTMNEEHIHGNGEVIVQICSFYFHFL